MSGLLSVGRAETLGDFTYTTNDVSATITGYTGPGGNVTIPDVIDGKPVTSIGDYAFSNCTNLTGVTISTNVINLGKEAFYGCRSLTHITIPNSVTSLGSSTFAQCHALTNATLSNNITNIVDMMFVSCSNLAKITIPGSVTSIGMSAFGNCPKLVAITIPNSVTNLGDYAFSSCRSLTEIIIPDSVKNFGTCTFFNCLALTNVILPTNITNIMDWMFSGCSSLANIKLPETVTRIGNSAFYNCTNLTEITIPNSVTNIGAGAFHCTRLTSITIPDSVTNIGDNAFSGCAFLSSITIPAGVTNIGTFSFGVCANLTAITVDPVNAIYSSVDGVLFNKSRTILVKYPDAKDGDYVVPNGVATIDYSAFYYSSKLTNITIPDGVISIGNRAFASSTHLAHVDIPESVIQISDFAFYGCANLANIAIPASVITLGTDALAHCSSLNAITVDAANTNYSSIDGVLFKKGQNTLLQCPGGKTSNYVIPSTVTLIRETAFAGCAGLTGFSVPANSAYSVIDGVLFNKDQNTLILCPEGRTGSVTIPDSVTKMGAYAFAGCSGLTNISIPNTIDTISTNAFYNCTGLSHIAIPSSVHRLCDSAFMGCAGLASVIIPSSVNWMEILLFSECTNLTSVFFEGDAPKSDSSFIFTVFFNADQVTVYYRAGTKGWWKDFGGRPTALWIEPSPITDFTYTTNDVSATITKYTGPGGNVIIPDAIDGKPVVVIGDNAFADCIGLTNIALPGGVTTIGTGSFSDCVRLSNIEIPANILKIRDRAFSGCAAVTNITIAAGTTNIGALAFFGCNSLMNITVDPLNTAFTSVDGVLFNKNQSLLIQCPSVRFENYRVPKSVKTVQDSAFSGCSRLTAITVDPLNTAFYSIDGALYLTSLTNLVACPAGKSGSFSIAEKTTGIRSFAFSGCNRLTNIIFPISVYSIRSNAFLNCTGLTSITILPGSLGITDFEFSGCTGLKSVVIPSTATFVSVTAFNNCTNLLGLYFQGNRPKSLAGSSVQQSFDSLVNATVYYRSGTTGWATSLGGWPTALWIDSEASDFVWNETWPGVTITGYSGSGGNAAIPATIFGYAVTIIGDSAFAGQTNLARLTIPNSVTNIGASAFADCTNLTEVYFGGNAPTVSGAGDLFTNSPNVTVYYRAGTTGWGSTFAGRPSALWIEQPSYQDWAATTGLTANYPDASAETDDADDDAMTNLAEMQADTDPTNPNSKLAFESVPRPTDLEETDKTALTAGQHALFFQTVPGKQYNIQILNSFGGTWQTETNLTATTSQKRVLVDKPVDQAFYRVVLVP